MEIINTLLKLGINENESKTYVALLELKEATATKLSQTTSINRTLMYEVTNKLIEKGLASFMLKRNIKYFSAVEPEFLLKDLQEKENELKNILPKLKEKQNKINKEISVGIYKGKKGVYSMLKFITSQNTPYYSIGGMGEICSKFENEAIAVIMDTEKSKIEGRILARKEDRIFIGKNEKLKFLPKQMLSSTSLMMVGDKTVVFIWTEPYYAIFIDNPEFTKDNLRTFEYLWKIAQTPTQKEIKERLFDKKKFI